MSVGLSFNDIQYDKSTNTTVELETGEILEPTKLDVKVWQENQKRENDLNKCKERELKKSVGIVDRKDLLIFNWKSGKKVQFIKIYRTEMREYKERIKLSPNAGLLLFYIQDYIELETNRIAKPNKSSFTNKEFQKLTGLGRDAVEKVLKELEDLFFIKRKGQRQAREIYFNPYLMCSGNRIEKEIVKLFEDYTPCTPY